MGVPKPSPIRFGEPARVRVEDPVTLAAWEGQERLAELPKPGGGARVARVAKALLSPEEALGLLQAAKALEFVDEEWSCGSSSSVQVMEAGQYLGKAFAASLRPVVDGRLLPFVRSRLGCPGAVVRSAEVWRRRPGGAEADSSVRLCAQRLSFCTAVLALNPEDARGGVFLQARANVDSPGFVPLDCGDLLLHQYDLPQGVRVQEGEWYGVAFHFKDSILACLTNTAPWYEPLAERGDADAQAGLAFLMESGTDERGPASVVRWCTLAAEQGHPEAQERLGSLYMAGEGSLGVDATKAVHWWHKAALQGQRLAQRRLAEALLRGRGAERNTAEASRWLRRSAEQGDEEAMYLMVIACSTGTGSPPDPQEALAWCERGARAGHPELQHRLAVHLLTGNGLRQDAHQAVHWFQRAAESGHPRALCNLGVLHAQGLGGLARSPAEARRRFERAATAGDAEGQYNLALLLARGAEGLPASPMDAIHWCRLAEAQGHSRAKTLLEDLERGSCQKEKEPSKSLREAAPARANGASAHGGLPPVSLDASHRARLAKLLSELHAMRETSADGEAREELVDVLRCLEAASQDGFRSERPAAHPKPSSPTAPQQPQATAAPAATEDAPCPPRLTAAAPAEPSQPSALPRPRAAAAAVGAEEGAKERPAGGAAGGVAVLNGKSTPAPEPEKTLPAAVATADAAQQQSAASEPQQAAASAPQQAAAPPAQQQAEERPFLAPDQTSTTQRRAIPRVSARRTAEVRQVVASGEPALIADAMPHLSGRRVVDFMPKLINAAGKEQISYEIQGAGGELQLRRQALALYVQGLQRSAPGRAHLMMSDRALRHPELSEFLVPPACLGPDHSGELPAEFQPVGSHCLLMGGRGATTRLHRSPSATCTWSLLVLGRARWRLLPPGGLAEDGSSNIPEGEAWEATQEIGEVLLLPPGWWSQAWLEDRSLAVLGQRLPEESLALAAAQVARQFDISMDLNGPRRDPWEIFKRAAEEARRREPQPDCLGLRAALQSSARSELRSPSQQDAS